MLGVGPPVTWAPPHVTRDPPVAPSPSDRLSSFPAPDSVLSTTSNQCFVRVVRSWTGSLSLSFGGPTEILLLFRTPVRGNTRHHWEDVRNRADNRSVEIKKRKWVTLCTTEWPTLDVGWPKEGTFNLDLILQVKSRVFIQGPQGHPDQIPYIVTWEDLAFDPPPWVAPFSPPKLPLRPLEASLSPSAPLSPVPAPPPKTSRLYPILSKPETSALSGAKSKKVLPPEDSTLIDLMTEEPPPYQPQPLPAPDPVQASSEEEDQEDPTTNAPPGPSPMVGRLRG
ncbi:uncharacterized protein LOC125612396 [Marmota marmota marmota]|uniref:uncharacterized protein LOC125612396 n=1 Tax=Marmota marmota marmota TaxID=9994 RepID=UPI00209239C0|nr:uncharacterized protein LOC125612396 [Marmota marmota marmota]